MTKPFFAKYVYIFLLTSDGAQIASCCEGKRYTLKSSSQHVKSANLTRCIDQLYTLRFDSYLGGGIRCLISAC